MKNFFLPLVMTAAMIPAFAAPAEILFYKGATKDSYVGSDHSFQVTFKLFVIIDHATANEATISYYTDLQGHKLYSTSTRTNLHIVEATGTGGKVYTVISHPLDSCALDAGFTSEGIFLQGANATLTVDANNGTVSFPSSLRLDSHGFSPSSSRLVNGGGAVVFDKTDTVIASSAGETLDQSLARAVQIVQKLGYGPAPTALRTDAAAFPAVDPP